MDGYFLTGSHERLRAQVRDFAQAEIAPRVTQMESARAVERALARQIARQGWLGVTIGTSYGGMGAGHVAKTVIVEELARVSGAMGAMAQASQLGVAKILHYGSEQQQRAWLPQIAAGECLPTIAVTEAGSGSRVLGIQTTARRRRRHYVLNGSKVFVGNSHIGTLHGVVARTARGSEGLSAFLVEAGTPGLTVAAHQPALGLHGFSFGEIRFEDCLVPAENRLGTEGDGLGIAYSSSILYGRPNLAAVALGIHQAIAEETAAFCTKRERYGNPLGALDTVRAKLGRIHSRLMTARTLAYQAAAMLDTGQPCDAELMNAKLVGADSVVDSARDAMDIHAASGLLTEGPIERLYRDAVHMNAPAGTADIQLHRLGETALGTERDQWSQRHLPHSSLATPTSWTSLPPACEPTRTPFHPAATS